MVYSQNIELERCESAEDFMRSLNPMNAEWHPRQMDTGWIYRGQEDANWHLVASANRADHGFDRFPKNHYRPDTSLSTKGEKHIAASFERLMRDRGIDVPRFPTTSSDPGTYWKDDENQWPRGDDIPVLALAQHEGLPTRLLDWSSNAYVAAYFAAIGAVANKRETLAVWAIHRGSLSDSIMLPEAEHGPPLTLLVVKPPPIGNAKLLAQSGFFTYFKVSNLQDHEERILPTQDGFLLDHLRLVDGVIGGLLMCPTIRKLTLTATEAPTLLKYLSKIGVDASTLFPGAQGASKYLREIQYYS